MSEVLLRLDDIHVRFANQFAGRSTEKEGAAAAMPRFTPADAEAR